MALTATWWLAVRWLFWWLVARTGFVGYFIEMVKDRPGRRTSNVRCAAVTAKGEPCPRWAKGRSKWCRNHDPREAQRRSAVGRLRHRHQTTAKTPPPPPPPTKAKPPPNPPHKPPKSAVIAVWEPPPPAADPGAPPSRGPDPEPEAQAEPFGPPRDPSVDLIPNAITIQDVIRRLDLVEDELAMAVQIGADRINRAATTEAKAFMAEAVGMILTQVATVGRTRVAALTQMRTALFDEREYADRQAKEEKEEAARRRADGYPPEGATPASLEDELGAADDVISVSDVPQ